MTVTLGPARSRVWAAARQDPARSLFAAAAVAALVATCLIPTARRLPLDFRVYRGAAETLLAGGNLYSFFVPDIAGSATFLYPPFAALLVVPTLLIPAGPAATAWTLAHFGFAAVLVCLLVRDAGWQPHGTPISRMLPVAGLWTGVACSGPLLSGVENGQVSVLIVTLVMVDLLLLPPKWRGVLVGVAAAIKLTPILIVGYLVVSRQWRTAWTAAGSFAAAGLAGLLLAPAESIAYWTQVVFDSSRVPSIDSERNLSIFGAMRFWFGSADWVRPAWTIAAAVTAAAAMWAAARHHRRGETAAAVLVICMATAAVSPVAWSHYLLWLPLVGVYLALSSARWQRRAGVLLLVSCFALSPIWPIDGAPWWWACAGVVPVAVAAAVCVAGLPGRRCLAGSSASATLHVGRDTTQKDTR